MAVPPASWPGVALPDDVEDFAREGREGVAVRIPAAVLQRGRVIRCLAGKVNLH